MDFTSSSGPIDSNSVSSQHLSSNSDIIETDELRLIKLNEYKVQLLRDRSKLLEQLREAKPAKRPEVEFNDKVLFQLLRLNTKEDHRTMALPSVLPSLDIESRKDYLRRAVPDIEISLGQNQIIIKRKEFVSKFHINVENETIKSLKIDVNMFEIELLPVLRYCEQNNNINVAMMGIYQFLNLKRLHEEMIAKIIASGHKFKKKTRYAVTSNNVNVSFQILWSIPSPYPQTVINTNKNQKVLDYLIYQYGIELGIDKYGTTFI